MATPAVVIIGGGPSGICAGVALLQARIPTFTILEMDTALGGTWHANRYPNAGCDVTSHLYSFSFALNSEWSRLFSMQPEIHAYLDRVARRHGLHAKTRVRTQVVSATWTADKAMWCVRTRRNSGDGNGNNGNNGNEEEILWAHYVFSCVGGLCIPRTPQIAGVDAFKGKIMHTARWDTSFDLRDKNVLVIGNAASGLQVIPALQRMARNVVVFQRSPNYVTPRNQFVYPEAVKWIFRNVPGVMRAHNWFLYLYGEVLFFAFKQGTMLNWLATHVARRHLKRQVKDPKLRKLLTPNYPLGCKRVLISDDYYPALQQPNVQLVTDAVHHVGADGVATHDGAVYKGDVLVFATGFDVGRLSVNIIGKDGYDVNEAFVSTTPEAYLGVTTRHAPNLFMTLGPNSGNGHNSALMLIEAQVNYCVQIVSEMWRQGAPTVEVKHGVFAAYNARIQKALESSVWAGSCTSWYKSKEGRIFAAWPHTTIAYAWALWQPRWSDFDFAQTKPTPSVFTETLLGRLLGLVLTMLGIIAVYH